MSAERKIMYCLEQITRVAKVAIIVGGASLFAVAATAQVATSRKPGPYTRNRAVKIAAQSSSTAG